MIESIANSQQTSSNATSPISQKQKSLFAVAAVTAAKWIVLLLILSVTTANPVTMNRDQIIDSTDVVTALVVDPQSGVLQIQQSWKSVVTDEELKIVNLAAVSVTKGDRFIIPVLRDKDAWYVTPSKLPKNPRLIYPASDESERQLKSILKTGHLP